MRGTPPFLVSSTSPLHWIDRILVETKRTTEKTGKHIERQEKRQNWGRRERDREKEGEEEGEGKGDGEGKGEREREGEAGFWTILS